MTPRANDEIPAHAGDPHDSDPKVRLPVAVRSTLPLALRNINGKKCGMWSLRLDAAYCVVLGAAVALLSGQIAEGIALPAPLVAIAGIAVVVWAGGILWMLARLPLRSALRFVMVANVFAALAVGFISATAATLLVVLAVVAVAIDVALFAASQAVALRALPPS